MIGSSGNIIRYEQISNGTKVVILKENKSRRSGFWPKGADEMPEVRPATPEETLLLAEAIPSALRQVRDEASLRLHGTADLQQAQALTERLMDEAGKKLKLEDQTRRLSQVRDYLASEGLIYKKEQA